VRVLSTTEKVASSSAIWTANGFVVWFAPYTCWSVGHVRDTRSMHVGHFSGRDHHTSVVASTVVLAAAPVSVFTVCPVCHAAKLVCFRVGRIRYAIEHSLAGDLGSPCLLRGQRRHKVEERYGRHDVWMNSSVGQFCSRATQF